jgi:hypothetical protein
VEDNPERLQEGSLKRLGGEQPQETSPREDQAQGANCEDNRRGKTRAMVSDSSNGIKKLDLDNYVSCGVCK